MHARGMPSDASGLPRVLFFSPYRLDDPRSGGERRSALYWDLLRETGAPLDTIVHARPRGAPLEDAPGLHALEIAHGTQRFYDPRLARIVRARIAAFRPDLLWIEQFYTAPLLLHLARRVGLPAVYNSQNVEAERFAAWSPLHQFAVRRYERIALRGAQWTVCVSERDRGIFVRDYGADPARCVVLPNGYDDRVFHPAPMPRGDRDALWAAHGIPADAFVCVFPGNQAYAPNAEARRWILAELAPALARIAPRARIALVGPELPAGLAAPPNVHPIGFVDDLPHHLRAADLCICPLAHGGGTRLKIVESLACGLPVLSTAKGAEGLDDAGEAHGLYRCERGGFAARLAALAAAPPPPASAPAALARPALAAAVRSFLERVASSQAAGAKPSSVAGSRA